MLIAFYILF